LIPRYSLPAIADLFSDEARFSVWLEVEILAVEAWATLGVLPQEAARAIRERAAFTVAEIDEREKTTDHDVAAFVDVVQSYVGPPHGTWVHYGLTSSDVVDTALAVTVTRAVDLIIEAVDALEAAVAHGILVLRIDRDRVLETVRTLKEGYGFDLFLDVTAVDWPEREPRFDVVWHFYSTRDFVRLCVKTRVPLADPVVDTLTGLYGSAHYMERECHDMYGIVFRGNDDLRPILLYEGFEGHPLRKDYPKQLEQPLVPYREPKP